MDTITASCDRKQFEFCVGVFATSAEGCLREGGSLMAEAQSFAVSPNECADSASFQDGGIPTDFITVSGFS